jgi:hypothetical protein
MVGSFNGIEVSWMPIEFGFSLFPSSASPANPISVGRFCVFAIAWRYFIRFHFPPLFCRLSEITATVAEFYTKIPDGVNVSPVRYSKIFAEYGHKRQWLFRALHHLTAVNNNNNHIRLDTFCNADTDIG